MSTAKIPHGDDKVTVQLTIKELMALTGVRFYDNNSVKISARQKLNEVLEEVYGMDQKTAGSDDYHYLF